MIYLILAAARQVEIVINMSVKRWIIFFLAHFWIFSSPFPFCLGLLVPLYFRCSAICHYRISSKHIIHMAPLLFVLNSRLWSSYLSVIMRYHWIR